MREKTDSEKKIEHAILPLLEEGGYELVQLLFFKSPQNWVLRILVDREGGITIDECVRLAKEMKHIISVEEIRELNRENLIFEVSSPGVERPLTKEQDFAKFAGRKVRIKTISSVNDSDPQRKNFTGALEGFSQGNIHLKLDDQSKVLIPFQKVDKAHLVYEGVFKKKK
ncbi:MAG: ribosome maturation factor RimP [Deltaproteobacteria bacterium]|nr:ribosome maturation factor RimP [Deltaproteobacteria bacterium]